METFTETDSKVAGGRGELRMRLPLELIIMILEALAASSEQSELMYLRTVSSEYPVHYPGRLRN